MPNDNTVAGTSWEDYQVSVACIEQRTGLDRFAAVADEVEVLARLIPVQNACNALRGDRRPPALSPATAWQAR